MAVLTETDVSARLDGIVWLLVQVLRDLQEIKMSQSDIDAQIVNLQGVTAQLGAAVTAIQQELTTLQTQGVDTSGLDAAVAQLDTAAQAVSALAPAPAAPAAPDMTSPPPVTS